MRTIEISGPISGQTYAKACEALEQLEVIAGTLEWRMDYTYERGTLDAIPCTASVKFQCEDYAIAGNFVILSAAGLLGDDREVFPPSVAP